MRDTVDQPKTSLVKKAWEARIELFLGFLGGLAFVLFIAILYRGFVGPEANWMDDWLGTSQLEAPKWETIKILGQSLLGLGAIIGIYAAYRRASGIEAAADAQKETAQAQQETAEAQHKTAQAQHDANEQKMFNDATAKLGDKSPSVRLGGIYALDTLARSNEAYLVRIVKILCAHLRETTQQKDYQENHKNEPSNEIQSLLEVLSELNRFSEEKKEGKQSKPVRLNLSGAYLVGANLENACLNRTDLSRADMRKARLFQAHLQKADLKNAKMQRAISLMTQMQGASLWGAQMQGAILLEAQMQVANLWAAQMQGASLRMAQMQGTLLLEAQMQGADLKGAQMQGANLRWVQMQGARLWDAQMQGANVDQMQVQGAKPDGVDLRGAYCQSSSEELSVDLPMRIDKRQGEEADLGTVIFSGGLKAEDVQYIREQLTECQKNGWMTQEEVERIIAILEEHQDKPASNKPPSGIKIGSYDENEAEAIIDKYKEAMAEVELWG